jgi:hypothetical protein
MSNRIRLNPRISVNKLGEYLVAKPGRRLTIISDQKNPRDFIVARYSSALDAIARSIAKGCDPLIIREAIEKLYDTTPKSMWHQQDIELSVEALDLFLNLIDDLDLSGFEAVRTGEGGPADLLVEGVTISVRPDLYLRDKSSKEVCGVVKLSILKGNAPKENEEPDNEAVLYVGAVVHQYANDVLSPVTRISAENCLVIDVFAQRVYEAPKSFKRRRADVAAACREIARGWSGA